MRIDTHQHFWKYSRGEYPWIISGMEVLARDRLPGDLKPLLDEMGISGTVAVQARQTVQETDALLRMARENDFIRGVVGWVDLRSPRVEEQLDRYRDCPKVVGVRHVVQDEPDDRFMLGPEFLHGIASLERYGLVYDILIFSHQLPAAAEMVRRFPDQVFVLDHIAKPSIRDGRTMPWASDIKGLAALPNVSCKMSGMVTEARWQDWTVEDFTPYMETVLEAFGPDRLLIGSDWPVCTLAGDYRSVMSIAADFVSRLSASEQKAIWEDNPVGVYGLRLG